MDTKRVLLGSTAIVGAGMFFANPAHAQLEVTLSGYTEFGVIWAEEQDEVQPPEGSGQNFDFFMDNEVFIQAQGTDDATGIIYGSRVEIEVGSFGVVGEEDDQGDAFTDEVQLFFSGAFGRVELGQDDGAADVMQLDAASVAAGTGGIDGDLPILLTTGAILDTGDAAKVTYFTPRVAGFQAGISYVPDVDLGPVVTEDFIEAGVNFVGQFAGFDLGVSAVATLPDGFEEIGDSAAWAVGGTAGFAGLNFGASYGNEEIELDDFAGRDLTFITAGVGFGLGPANASFNYEYDDFNEGGVDDAHLFVVSADVGLMPGVVLKGDVGYTTDNVDIGEVLDEDEADDSFAAVLTVQLNY